MRVQDGDVTLKTRKGLDWTKKFGAAISLAARELPDCLVDGEIVALDHRGAPDFAGLQAALSEGRTDDLIFLRSIFSSLTARTCDRKPFRIESAFSRNSSKTSMEKTKP